MKLKELKNMIAEEYSRYLREQAPAPPMGGTPPVPRNAGGMPTPGPGISVGPDDIQVDDDGGNAEEMLQNIFNMLQMHFGDGAPEPTADDDLADMDADDNMGGDEEMNEPENVEDDEEDEEADLEEWRGKGDKKVTKGSKSSSGPNVGYKKATTTRGHTGYDGGKGSMNENVISRMQKLANIKK